MIFLQETSFSHMQVRSSHVNIRRSERKGNISIKFTVPFGCPIKQDGSVESCGLDIGMNVPHDSTKCTQEIKALGKNCGLRILNKDWNNYTYFHIVFIDSQEYELPKYPFRIGMITGSKVENPAWSGIELQDVLVHVGIKKILFPLYIYLLQNEKVKGVGTQPSTSPNFHGSDAYEKV